MAPDPKRSIKPWIPQTQFADDPAYEYKPYPRMMNTLCTEAYLKDWLEHNSVIENGKVSYKGGRPRIGSLVPVLNEVRQPVIVHSAAEEAEFLKANPPAEQVARVEVPAASLSTLAAQTAAKEQEVADLKAQIATPEKKRPGRPPKPQNLTAA